MTTQDDFDELYTKPKNFWATGKGVLTILAIAITATVLVMVLVILTVGPPEENVGVEADYTSEQTDSVCDLGGVALEGSIGSTPDADWEIHHRTYIPVNEDYGPAAFTPEGLPYCYEHSPRGMMFAATTYAGQLANPDQYDPELIDHLFSQGEHRQNHVEEAIEVFPEVYSGSSGAVGGFRLISYDGDAALIEVALTNFDGENTELTSMLMSMVWDEGDWKISTHQPSFPVEIRGIDDHIGFQQWRA